MSDKKFNPDEYEFYNSYSEKLLDVSGSYYHNLTTIFDTQYNNFAQETLDFDYYEIRYMGLPTPTDFIKTLYCFLACMSEEDINAFIDDFDTAA